MTSSRDIMYALDSLDGMTLDYNCSGGQRFVVRFRDVTASYWAVSENGWISNRNDNIPYHHRKIRPGLIYAVFYERSIGDIVSLIIDLDEQKIHSASLLGYPSDDRRFQFEDGIVNDVTGIAVL